MKKILSFILLLAGVTMVTSCGEDDATYTPVAPLEILSNNVLFETAGGTGTITVNTSDALTATTTGQWLAVSVSGNTVTVTAQENPSLSGRSAQIVLTSGGKTANVTATQKGLSFGVTEGLEYEVDDMANVIEVNFAHSLTPTITSLAEWITPSLEGTKLTLAVDENRVREARAGQVVVQCAEYADTINVYQEAMVFEVSGNSFESNNNAAASFDLVFKASKKISVARDVNWIGVKQKNDSTLTLSIPANEGGALRTGHFYIMCGDEMETIFIAQYDFMQEVSSGYYYFWYYDASAGKWAYMPSLLDLENGSLILAMTNDLMFQMPVGVSAEDNLLFAGPSTSFAGMYKSYYLYWVWRSTAGTWSGYSGKSYSLGELYIDEDDEGNVYSYIMWEGPLGDNTIDAWALRAMKAEGMSADNNAGYLTTFYFPQMEPMEAEARGKDFAALKRAKGVRTFRGHTGTPASTLKYVLRPVED